MTRPTSTSTDFTTSRPATTQTVVGARLAACALAMAILAAGLAYGATAVGGSDGYGYVSEAALWRRGWPRVVQEWTRAAPWPHRERTFAPIGYRPDARPGRSTVAVPVYAPGYPLLMAGAAMVAGPRAMFWVVPLSAAILVLATFGIGCRLGSVGAGLVGAWLVATSPTVLLMTTAVMSDVPSAAAWAAASYFLLCGRLPAAAAAGLCAGLGILIRPNLVPLAAVLGAWYPMRLWLEPTERRQTLSEGVMYSLGVGLGAVAIATINQHLYGSPLESGYGETAGMFAAAHILPNARNYAGWLARTQTPLVFAGFVTLAAPLRLWWPNVCHRSIFAVLVAFTVVLWGTYLSYLVFDAWWFLRFLLVGWPFMMVGVGAAFAAAFRARPAVRALAISAVVVLGANGVRVAIEENALQMWRGEQRFASTALQVRRMTRPNAVIVSFLHSGSVRYYGGRVSLRYDWLLGHWLDDTVQWLAQQGAHPYLLVDIEEIPDIRRRFAGQAVMAILDRDPLFVYRGQQSVVFFDLLSDLRLPPQPSSTLVETFESFASLEPAPQPHMVFMP